MVKKITFKLADIETSELNENFELNKVPASIAKLVNYATEFKNSKGANLSTCKEINFVNGVAKSDEQSEQYKEFTLKLDELVNMIKDEDKQVVILDDNMTNGKGVKSFGGYLKATNPNKVSSVKCHNSGKQFRLYSVAEYDKFDILFSQYYSGKDSGIFVVIFNKILNEDELNEFAKKLASQCTCDNALMEGELPEGDAYTLLEWNDTKKEESIKKAEDKEKKAEENQKLREAEKERKRKEKAEKDLKELKSESKKSADKDIEL